MFLKFKETIEEEEEDCQKKWENNKSIEINWNQQQQK